MGFANPPPLGGPPAQGFGGLLPPRSAVRLRRGLFRPPVSSEPPPVRCRAAPKKQGGESPFGCIRGFESVAGTLLKNRGRTGGRGDGGKAPAGPRRPPVRPRRVPAPARPESGQEPTAAARRGLPRRRRKGAAFAAPLGSVGRLGLAGYPGGSSSKSASGAQESRRKRSDSWAKWIA